MVNIQINIPDAVVGRVRDAIRGHFDSMPYPNVDYSVNPIADKTDAEAVRWVIAQHLKADVTRWENHQALEAARAAETQTRLDLGGIG